MKITTSRFLRTLGFLSIVFMSADALLASSEPPTVLPPPEPIITLTKDTGTNSIIFTWTASLAPYALSRATTPNYSIGPITALQGGIAGLTTTDVGILNDGVTYFYNLDDPIDGPKIYSLSVDTPFANRGDLGVADQESDPKQARPLAPFAIPLEAAPFAVISGTGVNIEPGSTTVNVNDVSVSVTTSTTMSFTFTLPDGTVSGYVMIENSTGTSAPIPFTVLNSKTALSNISSVAVDDNHVVFVSDIGTAGTSDKVYKVDPGYTLTQEGAIDDPISGGGAFDVNNKLYYGNGRNIVANDGTVETTSASGGEAIYGDTGCATPVDDAWVFGVAVDKDYFGTGKRVYVWDGAKKKIRLVPGGTCNATDMVGPFTGIVGRPQGIIANNNPMSTRRHNLTVTVTPAPEIREYNMLGTPTLVKTWTSANLPIAGPAQMTITPEPAERLVIADRTNNTVVLLNQATDKSRVLDWALTSPRAIAVDPLPSGAINAIVGEATTLKRFPLTFNAVTIQIYVESGSGVLTADAQAWFDRAKAYLLKCRVNLVLRAITTFTDPALRDVTWAAGGASHAPCGTYPFSTEETTLLSMRSAVNTDLNVYVIRNFIRDDTLAVDMRYGGFGITQDCYSNVADATQSGIAPILSTHS